MRSAEGSDVHQLHPIVRQRADRPVGRRQHQGEGGEIARGEAEAPAQHQRDSEQEHADDDAVVQHLDEAAREDAVLRDPHAASKELVGLAAEGGRSRWTRRGRP